MMLRKNPETRPPLERIMKLLEQMMSSSSHSDSSGFSALSQAAAEILEQSAKIEAQRLTGEEEQKRRENIAREAQKILWQIIDSLFERISIYAPNAKVSEIPNRYGKYSAFPDRSISVGTARLTVVFSRFFVLPQNAFSQSRWDVISGAIIKIDQKERNEYHWSANLWFTDLGKASGYRWWEVTYMTHPLKRQNKQFEPFAVDDPAIADSAAGPGMSAVQFGAKPKLADDEAIDEFCNRWADLLAKAAKGELGYPSNLPID
jgi:hypothetical protein